MTTAGIPSSWDEISGYDVVTLIGFELRQRSYQLGISERRAQWIINCTNKIAASTSVNVGTFEEELGRGCTWREC